ncbi:MAG: biotin--[acetyl-CoA-carboxylase] ligase [Candidatus Heimdallarchaeota archaeon]|nr:biotin--[acetyl-CoA-carboxylase] ligase [Candidatus Heimdallarchaeota archaeon]MDH5646377.1 biotin--[acetyl-CoA-carboxylase] ligase [Candidatus Heimdallarchaeota archaeon]
MKYLTFITELHRKLQETEIDPHQWEIRSIPIVGSTNDEADYLLNYYEKVVILSETQSQGRGRQKREWESPIGGIWMSIAVREILEVQELSTPLIHVIHEFLSELVECEIKYPNDIKINELKVCGLLVEGKVIDNKLQQIVIGIGLNVFNELPPTISNIATKLSDHCDNLPDLPVIAANLALKIISYLTTNILNQQV